MYVRIETGRPSAARTLLFPCLFSFIERWKTIEQRERERRKETTSGGERKLTRRRRPVNLYPPFLFWPGCGSFAHGWGQDRPTGSRTLVDLAAGFGILLVSGIRVRVCTEVANGLRRSRVCATNEERGRRKRVSRRIPKERGRRKRRARVVVSLSLPPFLSFSIRPRRKRVRGRGGEGDRIGLDTRDPCLR